jgi:hypothetical protein
MLGGKIAHIKNLTTTLNHLAKFNPCERSIPL